MKKPFSQADCVELDIALKTLRKFANSHKCWMLHDLADQLGPLVNRLQKDPLDYFNFDDFDVVPFS